MNNVIAESKCTPTEISIVVTEKGKVVAEISITKTEAGFDLEATDDYIICTKK